LKRADKWGLITEHAFHVSVGANLRGKIKAFLWPNCPYIIGRDAMPSERQIVSLDLVEEQEVECKRSLLYRRHVRPGS
jgi:hypothetical protein